MGLSGFKCTRWCHGKACLRALNASCDQDPRERVPASETNEGIDNVREPNNKPAIEVGKAQEA